MTFDPTLIRNPVWHLDSIDLRDPAVFLHEGVAHLFFTHYDFRERLWHIGATTTEDFISFSEIRLVSPEGYASPGNVVRDGDRFVLCYQQYRHFPHTLCVSWSNDLETWSAPIEVFNTGTDNRWNLDNRVIDPYLVHDGERWFCYYTGSTRWCRPSGHNLIGVAGSADLRHWVDLSPTRPVIGVDYPWEEPDGNENNCVIRRDGRWFMLYSASLAHQRIAWAVSDDLVNWDKGGLCDIPVPPAAATRFGAPFLIEDLGAPETTYMIYQGERADGRMSLLLMASHDLVHWVEPNDGPGTVL